MSDLIKNPEDPFSCVVAHFILLRYNHCIATWHQVHVYFKANQPVWGDNSELIINLQCCVVNLLGLLIVYCRGSPSVSVANILSG